MSVQLLYLERSGGGVIVYNFSVDGVSSRIIVHILKFILFPVSNLLVCLVYVYAFTLFRLILLLVLISILSISFCIFVA